MRLHCSIPALTRECIRSAVVVSALVGCSHSRTPASSTESVEPIESPAPSAVSPASNTPDAVSAPEVREQATAELESLVASRKTCSSDADCVNVSGACPFGCYIPVVKSAEAEVTAKLQELTERLDKAGHRCVYKCMAPSPAVCRAGRCATEAP